MKEKMEESINWSISWERAQRFVEKLTEIDKSQYDNFLQIFRLFCEGSEFAPNFGQISINRKEKISEIEKLIEQMDLSSNLREFFKKEGGFCLFENDMAGYAQRYLEAARTVIKYDLGYEMLQMAINAQRYIMQKYPFLNVDKERTFVEKEIGRLENLWREKHKQS